MRDIRRRIKSVVSTQKITKAMKMVSAAKLRKTQSTLVAVRPYSDKIQEVMNHLLGGGDDYNSPFLQPRDEVKNILYIGGRRPRVVRRLQYQPVAVCGKSAELCAGRQAGRNAVDW